MKALFTLCGILLSSLLFSQARIVMTAGSGPIGIKMAGGTAGNPIYIVMDNPSDNALNVAPGEGGIYSESEFNIVKWNIGTSTGTYQMPFLSPTPNVYVAPEVTITSAGAGAGSIEFSTYRHDNTLPNTPSDVTHMNYDATGLAGGSASAIDRFWIVDALGYTTKPSVNMAFTYDPAELEGTMDGNQLLVQRFNPSSSSWIDTYLTSTSSLAPSIATAVTPIGSGDFYRSWTLSDLNDPLPVELLDFQVECAGREGVKVEWATASEINNSHFVVERSEEGIFWEIISPEIHGAGNSNVQNTYSFTDNNPARGINYYRLTQVDFDGTAETFAASASDCDGDGFELVNVFGGENDNMMEIMVSASRNESFDMELLDMSGKRVSYQPNVRFNEGLHTYQINKGNLGYGIYYLRLINENEVMTRKILLN